jgi:selenocysteine lyase/cysteine desulfurase
VPDPSTNLGRPGLAASFPPVRGYLDAATLGLPLRATTAVLRRALDDWERGVMDMPSADASVVRAREAYARITGVPVSCVAAAPQVSVLVGLVAAALPDGAEVVLPEGDFASVVFPFLVHADRGVTVRHVPLDRLAASVGPRTTLVAYSAVQSADGRIADAGAVRTAARAVGALTLADLTQAAGWLPVDAGADDVTVCGTYKWLCSPRGTALLTVRPEVAARMRPLFANWYAGESIWDSVYGPGMTLAADARRFDVSPGWHAWLGTAPALEAFAAADRTALHAHAAGLADDVRRRLGLEPTGSAILALPDPDGALRARLLGAGLVVAGRAGRVRLSFHVWNDATDVERAVAAMAGAPIVP